jgi:hypothetical protein
MKASLIGLIMGILALAAIAPASLDAQTSAPPAQAAPVYTAAQLDQLVAPVALYDQTIRSDAHDSKTAMPYAGTRADGRNAFCESAVQLRHLIDRVGKGIVRDGLAKATEPLELVFLIVLS